MSYFKNLARRTVALLLSIILMASILPPSARAADYVLGEGEALVTNEAMLRDALLDGGIHTIYFGANIKLTSVVNIAGRPDGRLAIVGRLPNTELKYQYSDFSSSVAALVPLQIGGADMLTEIVFKDIELNIFNFYGIVQTDRNNARDARLIVEFNGVTGVGTQFVELPRSTFHIVDSTLEVRYMGAATAEEFADIGNLRLSGRVVLNHNLGGHLNSKGYSFFNFPADIAHSVTIADGATVTATSGYNIYGMFHFFYNVGGRAVFNMGKNASLTFNGYDRFSNLDDYGRFSTFNIGENSSVRISYDRSGAFTGLTAGAVNLARGASLEIYANNSVYTALRTNKLTLDQPRLVAIRNSGVTAAVNNEAAIDARGVKSMRYYNTVGDYNAGDQNRWFFTENGTFDVSATRWGSTSATIGSTSYASNLPYSNMTASTLGTSTSKVVRIDGGFSAQPTVNTVVEQTTLLTGNGVAGATITAESPATGRMTTTVNDDGSWEIVSGTPFVRDQQVSVTQTEALNGYPLNPSQAVTITVLRRGVRLIAGNNTVKTYDGDTLRVGVNLSAYPGYKLEKLEYVLIDNPDTVFDTTDSSRFVDAYNAALAEGKAGTTATSAASDGELLGTIGRVERNIAVWVRATLTLNGDTIECFDALSYRNLFTRYNMAVRGRIAGVTPADYLYGYTAVEGVYGIPYVGDGATVYGNPVGGHDRVRLSAKTELTTHWTVDVEPLLALDQDFLAANSMCDNGNPARYTLNYSKIAGMWVDVEVLFRTETGSTVTVDGANGGTINVPLTENGGMVSEGFFRLGGRFTPPHDDNNTPVGWAVGDDFVGGDYTPAASFDDAGFNPDLADVSTQKLFVIYKTGQKNIEVLYSDADGGTIAQGDTLTYDPSSPASVTLKPLYVDGYVPTGYVVTGTVGGDHAYTFVADSFNPGGNQYDMFARLNITAQDLRDSDGVTVVFSYTADENGNGIADHDEVMISIVRRGYTPGSEIWNEIAPRQQVATRRGYTISIGNSYPEAGSAGHTIAHGGGIWMFDEDINTVERVLTPDESVEVVFAYGLSTDGVKLDSRQYVTERFGVLDADGVVADTLAEQRRVYVLDGDTYNAASLAIDGYLYVGYRVEYENGDTHTDNVITYEYGTAPEEVTLDPDSRPERATVVYLYRPAAGTVTVEWVGVTYAGNRVTLATTEMNGFVGETVTVSMDTAMIGNQWRHTATFEGQTDMGELTALQVTLSEVAQQIRFEYVEADNTVTLGVVYTSDDGNVNISIRSQTLVNGEPVAVGGFNIPNYTVESWVLSDSQGAVMASGDGGNLPGSLDPSMGSQTLIISYRSTLTILYIRCIDADTGMEIDGAARRVDNLTVGEAYTAHATLVQGYELADGGALLRDIAIEYGTNTLEFHYRKITGGTLILRELENGNGGVMTEGRIIAYKNLDIATGTNVEVPDLTEAFYTEVQGQGETYNGETITYYYTKDMVEVEVAAIDQNGVTIASHVEMARKGEMYQAVMELSPVGYTLDDKPAKLVQALDGALVEFTFSKNREGRVDIVHQVTDGEGSYELDRYSVTVAAGSLFTATARRYEGFELTGAEQVQLNVSEQGNEIVFTYNDVRATVTVWLQDGPENSIANPQIHRPTVGARHEIDIPHVVGYTATGYQIDGGQLIALADGVANIVLDTVDGDMTVTVHYRRQIQRDSGTITVAVVDINGQPVDGASVTLDRVDISPETLAAGAARFDGLVFGDYLVTVTADGYVTMTAQVSISDDRTDVYVMVILQSEIDGGTDGGTGGGTDGGTGGGTDGGTGGGTDGGNGGGGNGGGGNGGGGNGGGGNGGGGNGGGGNGGGGNGGGGESEEPEKTEEPETTPVPTEHLPYINGYADGTVRPDGFITRAEAAVILYRLFGGTPTGAHPFTDVQEGMWYTDAVTALYASGVIRGRTDTTFEPSGLLTRAEMVTLLSRLGELAEGEIEFADVTANHWAKAYIVNATVSGWVNGYGDGSFRPERNITRAEMIKIVNAMLGRVHPLDETVDNGFVDLDSSHWAYREILEASVEHKIYE